jgi:hypothetical protein
MEKGWFVVKEPTFDSGYQKDYYMKLLELIKLLKPAKQYWFGRSHHLEMTKLLLRVTCAIDKNLGRVLGPSHEIRKDFGFSEAELVKCFKTTKGMSEKQKEAISNNKDQAIGVFHWLSW